MYHMDCPSCGSHLAGLSEVCPYCDADHSDEAEEAMEEAVSVLYCGGCGSYLGSLGGKSCSCGWNILK